MVDEFWGVVGHPGLTRPDGPLAVALLLTAAGFLLWVLIRSGTRRAFSSMDRAEWAIFIALCGASLLLSGLFPLTIPWTRPLLGELPATSVVLLFSAAPYLLAGVALNVPAAIIVGLVAGAGRAVGQTGAPLDIIAVGLAAGFSAVLMRQNYAGRLFGLVRRPPVVGPLGRLVIAAFTCLSVFTATIDQAGAFAALDLALFTSFWSILPLVVEGLIGGAIVSAVLWIVPHWRPDRGFVPSPLQRSLQRQLVTAFLAFAAVVVLLSAFVAFYFSARSTERALAEQMIDNADTTAAQLGALQYQISATLTQYSADPALAGSDPAAKSAALGRMRAGNLFNSVRLVSEAGIVIADQAGSNDPAAFDLSEAEREAVTAALAVHEPRWAIDLESGDAPVISLAEPAPAIDGERSAMLGRVAPSALAEVVAGLPVPGGRGFIMDEASRVILATGGATTGSWIPAAGQLAGRLTAVTGRNIYESLDPAGGARQLVSFSLVPQSGWKVVAITPHATILRQTLGIIGPLAVLLLAVSGLFYMLIAALGRDITQPIAEMSRASRAIAVGGGLERPVRSHREDEIGQLSLAFSQMQRALRQRLDELSLLLSVSNDVAATIHIDEGMSAVLQGVLRGTGAAGARAIVRNPNAPAPLVFAEGPAVDNMAPLDRAVLLQLRTADELAFSSSTEIESALRVSASPAAALFALPLKPAGDFQGALYLTYRQPHYFDSNERSLLRTLAGQATVLVQNAHLFAAAEGGRKRLAAILTSTTNGVIVTDPTDRVLLINPAMERALGLRAKDVTGRPVVDVLAGVDSTGELAHRLSLGMSAATGGVADGKLELEANGRAFLAGISTVYSNEGQTMGRVAVLQDVTDIVELDRMKSEFVAGISHDLLSPLTYMHNYAAMLPIVNDPALEHEYAEKIMVGIDRMKRLVNDLLDLARIEAGLNLQIDRVHIDELLAEVAQEYASPAKAQGVHLVVEASDDLPSVTADPALLRRAITNLVTNGLKYAADSGALTMRAESMGGEIVISVRDCGPGIAVADQAHLFEKFYRGRETAVDRITGSGLGLAIVKSVAEHHGGRVWCESVPGEGSTFYLALPQKL